MKDLWQQRSTPRILIVDDNPSIHRDFDLVLLGEVETRELDAEERRLYGAQLPPAVQKPAFRLDHAMSGTEAIEKVTTALADGAPYQLAFVDIRMPGIDGVETIERVWRLDPKVQVVICTAYADYTWEDLVRRLGPTDNLLVLKKPFDHIEATQMAATLTEKWFLARQAAVKYEELELLVARRTQKLLELQNQRSPATPVETSTSVGTDGAEGAREQPLVLLCAHDPKARQTVQSALSNEYRFVETATGEEALRLATEMVPDLVIAEDAPPQLDGLRFCRELRTNELTSHVPMLLLTGDGPDSAHVRALEAGADDVLATPLHSSFLQDRARAVLKLRGKWPDHCPGTFPPPAESMPESQMDSVFLRRVLDTIDKHLSDYEFAVDGLARKLAVSRRQLFRKLKAVTGLTPHLLIRDLRLKRAAQLLKESRMSVTEITYAVGFADLKHFRTVFREHYGVSPGEFHRGSAPKAPEAE